MSDFEKMAREIFPDDSRTPYASKDKAELWLEVKRESIAAALRTAYAAGAEDMREKAAGALEGFAFSMADVDQIAAAIRALPTDGVPADTITALHSRVAYLERANGLARLGLQAVCNLINESDGVYGLHLNGDGTPWETLMADGEFDWLADFEAATNVLLTGEKADG